MKNLFSFLSLIFILFSFQADAGERVTGIKYSSLDKDHFFELNYGSKKKPSTQLEFKPNVIQLSLPNTIVWPKQEKRVRLEGTNVDVSVLAYQFTKDTARFRVVFPEAMKVNQDNVSLVETGNGYRIVWKNGGTVSAKKDSYDENYLERLLNEKISKDGSQKEVQKGKVVSEKLLKLENEVKQDKINTALSATEKSSDDGLNDYLVKFFGIILALGGLCLVVLQMVKKGVLKKGKLNFLRNTQQIEQISSHHLSPKRSLHLVKVAGQVFFIGATDNGISLLSEVSSPGSVLKEAEKILAGDNFESNLETANNPEAETKEFQIKEDITKSEAGLEEKKTEFVNQLKERVKNLKSLQ